MRRQYKCFVYQLKTVVNDNVVWIDDWIVDYDKRLVDKAKNALEVERKLIEDGKCHDTNNPNCIRLIVRSIVERSVE